MLYNNDYIIDGYIISASIFDILTELQTDPFNYDGFLSSIEDKHEYVRCTCPFHKDGHESRPSASVYALKGRNVKFGTFNCFTCHTSTDIISVIATVLNTTKDSAKQWLIEHFASARLSDNQIPEFTRKVVAQKQLPEYLDTSILDNYNYWHPYMEKRHLTKEVVQHFKIGYDPETACITFPVWDRSGGLVMITRRSVNTKEFLIPKNVQKPVYLLNFILAYNIKSVVVCESQLDALVLWGWGIPAIALLGTGSGVQYDILANTDIRCYHLALDGDAAGDNGCIKFKKALGKHALVDRVCIPAGKDVNDLSEAEFKSLPVNW